MELQKILNKAMGVRFDAEEEERLDFLRTQEIETPVICNKFDCLNYGSSTHCYNSFNGCNNYTNGSKGAKGHES